MTIGVPVMEIGIPGVVFGVPGFFWHGYCPSGIHPYYLTDDRQNVITKTWKQKRTVK
ncbi:MAG: hypothetical protein PHI28_13305 [Mangrovibacterium sp.]|nr:hypothetical protein [Mangrovibacterium sp.]